MKSQADQERDQQILNITKELCLQLDIPNYNPTFVSWEIADSRSRRGVEFPADDVLVEKYSVTMPGAMRDKLDPDDFRPIIASSLIFSKKFRRRNVAGFFLSLTPFLLLALLLLVELPILVPTLNTVCKSGSCETSPLGFQIGRLAAPVVVALGTILLFIAYLRRIRLIADRRAADIVGATIFLQTLNKIAENKPGEVKRGGFIGRPIPLLPSLRTRISNLQRYSASVLVERLAETFPATASGVVITFSGSGHGSHREHTRVLGDAGSKGSKYRVQRLWVCVTRFHSFW